MTAFGRRDRVPAPDAVPALPAGFTDLVPVGRGSWATVYRAHHVRLDRTVALKVLTLAELDSRALRRFEVECRAAARISAHPHVVAVHDVGTAGGRPWVAMDHCSRGSLAVRTSTAVAAGAARSADTTGSTEPAARLGVADVAKIGGQLGRALSAAHAAGLVHGDVRGENVLVTDAGEPALADFGVARLLASSDAAADDTPTMTLVHAAPEVLEGDEAVAASDVYSLASLVWSLLAGRAPYAPEAGIGLAPLTARALRGQVPSLPRDDVPTGIEDALRAGLRVRPSDRPTAAALVDALERASRHLTGAVGLGATGLGATAPATPPSTTLPAETPLPAPSGVRGTRGLLVGVGAVALLGVLGGVGWGLVSAPDDPPAPPPEVVEADPLEPGEASGLSPRQVSVLAADGRLEVAWLLPDPAVIPYVQITPEVGEQLQLVPGQESVTVTEVDAGTQYCVTVAGLLSVDGQVTPVPASGDPACGTPR